MNETAPILTKRPAYERGTANHGWLQSHHTFSFADYFDPAEMGFSDLRVINDDRVAAGAGFATHGHRDMEIISYVLEGALEHKDSMGHGSIIRPGEIQRMSAGTGVTHSEFNPSQEGGLRFLQIWIIPDQTGVAPGYAQQAIPDSYHDRFVLLASAAGEEGALTIHQDAQLYATKMAPDTVRELNLADNRRGYLHVALGSVELNGTTLQEGDGVRVVDESRLDLRTRAHSAELLWFDLRGGRDG